jgi:hypothetical protein
VLIAVEVVVVVSGSLAFSAGGVCGWDHAREVTADGNGLTAALGAAVAQKGAVLGQLAPVLGAGPSASTSRRALALAALGPALGRSYGWFGR